MDARATGVFAVTVSLPRSYLGRAELRIGPDSVTLIARPIRHYRAIVLSLACVALVPLAVAFAIPGWALPGQLTLRAVLVGVIVGTLAGVSYWLLFRSHGNPRSMTLPRTSVSLVKHKGRVLAVGASFDGEAHSRTWTLGARTRDDADVIASALTTVST